MSDYGSNEWVISLWLNNDQGAQAWANEAMHSVEEHERGAALGEWFLESFVDESDLSEFLAGVVRDLLGHTDWDEIAEAVYVEES